MCGRIQLPSQEGDHAGDHVGPVEQGCARGGAVLLGVDLGNDGLPCYALVEQLHHRLGAPD